ncbi:MAG TPA: hypothetical protein DCK98_01965 [Chloroflexi bacterium]|jgi:hypothetical protein|nr:hypothetical protein [Chloroflexota bacterium]HAL25861.1 hypothetical protein [Chloroflexota bacterium]
MSAPATFDEALRFMHELDLAVLRATAAAVLCLAEQSGQAPTHLVLAEDEFRIALIRMLDLFDDFVRSGEVFERFEDHRTPNKADAGGELRSVRKAAFRHALALVWAIGQLGSQSEVVVEKAAKVSAFRDRVNQRRLKP